MNKKLKNLKNNLVNLGYEVSDWDTDEETDCTERWEE